MKRAPLGNSDGATKPGSQEYAYLGPALADDLCERQAVEIGHRHIGKECPNVGVDLQDCERLLAIASFEDAVARFAQHVIRQKPDKGFVFDNENYNGSRRHPSRSLHIPLKQPDRSRYAAPIEILNA